MSTTLQQLVDELQDMKKRKSRLMFELQALERDEFGIVQRLQIELGITSTHVSSDEPSKRAVTTPTEDNAEGPMKRARVDVQATAPTPLVPTMPYPASSAMQSLSLPTQPTQHPSMADRRSATYLGPPPSSLPPAPLTYPVPSNPTPQPWPLKSGPMAMGSLPSALPRAPTRAAPISTPMPSDFDSQQAQHRERQLQLAVRLRGALGDIESRNINMKLLLKTGVLAGEPVEYRKQSGAIINTGVLTPMGCVLCNCAVCKVAAPPAEISCSLFEEHSGSSMKRPADFIWLQHYSCTIKELITMAQAVDLEQCCRICGHGGEQGELLCCDVCTSSFHGTCLGVHATGGRGPECPACKAKATGTPFNVALATAAAFAHTPSPSDHPSATSPISVTPTHSPSPPSQSHSPHPHPDDHLHLDSSHHLPSHSAPPCNPPGAAAAAAAAAAVAAANAAHRQQAALARQLFQGGGVRHGERVRYAGALSEAQQLQGLVHCTPSLAGILCSCCSKVITPAEFEQHAGYAQRRAPFDHIRTDSGLTLRQLAERQASEPLLQEFANSPLENGSSAAGTPDNRQVATEPQDLQQLLWQQSSNSVAGLQGLPPCLPQGSAPMSTHSHGMPASAPMAGAEVYVSG